MPNSQPLAVTFAATYRASGYSAEDAAALRLALQRVAPTRVRPLYPPEAGGSTEVWLILSFIGGSLASGIIYDTAKAAVSSVRSWFDQKRTRYRTHPEIMQLAISLDDRDIELVPSYEAGRTPARTSPWPPRGSVSTRFGNQELLWELE